MQVREPEYLMRPSLGIAAGQRRQQIALLRQRFAQRRQRRFGLRQCGFLRRDIAAVGVAGI